MTEGMLPVDDPDYPLYTVAQATEALGVNPPTLRRWEREGLVAPQRTGGGQRRYSRRELQRLQQVAELASAGVTTAGIRRILHLEQRVSQLEGELADARAQFPDDPERQSGGEQQAGPSERLRGSSAGGGGAQGDAGPRGGRRLDAEGPQNATGADGR